MDFNKWPLSISHTWRPPIVVQCLNLYILLAYWVHYTCFSLAKKVLSAFELSNTALVIML